MSKTLTNLNPKHPHTRLQSFKQALKEQYRNLATAQLDILVNGEFMKMSDAEKAPIAHPTYRHEKLQFLIARGVAEFKQRWAAEYGWDFDDSYIPDKLHANMARTQIQAQERELVATHVRAEARIEELSKTADLTPQLDAELKEWNRLLDASPFVREGDKLLVKPQHIPEPFDASQIIDTDGKIFTKEEFDALPQDHQSKIRAYIQYRIAMLIRSGFAGIIPGGGIVDRRLIPAAIACQRSTVLGTPEPLPVPALVVGSLTADTTKTTGALVTQ